MNTVHNIIRFVVLFLLQIFLFNHLNIFGLCHPYVYILGLICMPLMPRWVDMIVAFGVGFLMDMICSSLGVHTAACVLIAYLRPLLLARMVQDLNRIVQDVTVATIGMSQYIRLAVAICLVHHAVVFMMDAGGFACFGITLARWLISSLVTMIVLLGYGALHKS